MSDGAGVGDRIAVFLERCGVTAAFGVISIHNMPILDAMARRDRIRFVAARGEAGAVAMADAHARVGGGLGVAVTSTGTGAGNACGALVEAQTAGTPLLHLTGQIPTEHLDRRRGFIHEARDQLGMLRAVSKDAYRVRSADSLAWTLRQAVRAALARPAGPVSVEIPIDVQEVGRVEANELEPASMAVLRPPDGAIERLADTLAGARRPMLWLGGGARDAAPEAARLAALGFGVVTSVHGRGIVPEDHPMSLGAFNLHPPVEAFYRSCDAMLVAGSRLRSNETLEYTLDLPRPLLRIDANPAVVDGGTYAADGFVCSYAAPALAALADLLDGRLAVEPRFAADLAAARRAAEAGMRDALGPYAALFDGISRGVPRDLVWVRDVTLANSMWGNRMPPLAGPRDGVHALGGGIGLGTPMAVGAALAAGGRKTAALIGDGGLALSLGELATAVQENADIAFIVMNDRGYGVIRNIQDAKFDGRRRYADLDPPDLAGLAGALGLRFHRVADAPSLPAALRDSLAFDGPALIEIDMTAIGPFARPFAGPPVRARDEAGK